MPPHSRTRPGEVDPTKGLSLDPDEFFEQQARREKALRMQDVIRPGRTTPIAIRFDQFTLARLKALAAARNTGYQTLLKEFVVERLYEEEKREGIIQ
jgi:predicted DNA binding CopG/RHH family protein